MDMLYTVSSTFLYTILINITIKPTYQSLSSITFNSSANVAKNKNLTNFVPNSKSLPPVTVLSPYGENPTLPEIKSIFTWNKLFDVINYVAIIAFGLGFVAVGVISTYYHSFDNKIRKLRKDADFKYAIDPNVKVPINEPVTTSKGDNFFVTDEIRGMEMDSDGAKARETRTVELSNIDEKLLKLIKLESRKIKDGYKFSYCPLYDARKITNQCFALDEIQNFRSLPFIVAAYNIKLYLESIGYFLKDISYLEAMGVNEKGEIGLFPHVIENHIAKNEDGSHQYDKNFFLDVMYLVTKTKMYYQLIKVFSCQKCLTFTTFNTSDHDTKRQYSNPKQLCDELEFCKEHQIDRNKLNTDSLSYWLVTNILLADKEMYFMEDDKTPNKMVDKIDQFVKHVKTNKNINWNSLDWVEYD